MVADCSAYGENIFRCYTLTVTDILFILMHCCQYAPALANVVNFENQVVVAWYSIVQF